MKLFVDTGSIKDIETIAALGILDGVTTNPSLLAKEPGDFRQNLKRICDIVKGPVSGEVTATDFAGMMREGHDLAGIDPHVVVMDFRLPGMDGVETTIALGRECPNVAVLCLTASASPRELDALRAAGAVDCLRKDQELDEIVAAIRRAGESRL